MFAFDLDCGVLQRSQKFCKFIGGKLNLRQLGFENIAAGYMNMVKVQP